MARAPRPGPVLGELEPLLGVAGCAALAAALISRAVAWAAAVAPERLHVAHEPADADAAAALRTLVGAGAQLFAQAGSGPSERLSAAAARVFAGSAGPLLAIWPELGVWRPEHATAALTDLRTGGDLALGPVFDGGFYLVGLARPLPAGFTLPEDGLSSPDAMVLALGAAHTAGLEVGLLRAERGLRRPADVRAALADPLLDPELAALLRPA